jgi:HK97 family phage portal protein
MAHKGGPSIALMGGGVKSVGINDLDRFLDFLSSEQSGTATRSPEAIYKTVAWAYRCVQLRAWGVSSVPYIICKRTAKAGDAEPIDFPMLTRDLLWRSEAAECLWGVNYVLKAQNAAGVVKKLQWLNPLTMIPKIETGVLLEFEQRAGPLMVRFTPEQIIYSPQFNPSNDLAPGVSAMHVAMEAAGLAANANQWASRFFSHGAIPAVILSTDQPVADEEIPRIRTAWENLTSGVKNAWRTVILRNGLTPTIVGMPVKDLAMPELFQQVRSQIACAFEIPETMLTDAANFATSAEHRRSFWLETIVPHAEWHAEAFNHQLLWPLGLEMRLQSNELEAVQKDEADKAASMKAMIDAATAVFTAKLCDEEEARAVISSAYGQMNLPELAKGWTPPKPAPIPPALQPFTGQPAPEPLEEPEEGEEDEEQPKPKKPKPPAPPKAMLDDLDRWQRKCEKAGKARPFESGNIPDDVHDRIADMLPSCLTVDEIRGVFAPFLDVKQLPFIPRGASEPLPAVPDVVEITEHDIDMAIKDWDTIFPEYAGLLNASVKGGGEAEANAGPY